MSSKTSEGGKTSDDNVSIVKKVEEYFYNSDDFAQIFEDFAIKNAPKVDLSTDECKLEYTEMFNEFLYLLIPPQPLSPSTRTLAPSSCAVLQIIQPGGPSLIAHLQLFS